MRIIAKEYSILIVILLIICFTWQGLEFTFDGKIEPSISDSIVAIILTLSLYANLKCWLNNRK